MENGWTPERRARQAELIRQWKPWERSTGPRTSQGKERSSKNADKGRMREILKTLGRALKVQKREIEAQWVGSK